MQLSGVCVAFVVLVGLVVAQEHPEWVQVDENKCGGCEKEHFCYKPKQFDYPRMCVPKQFEINLSFKKSLNKYCKSVVSDFFETRMQPVNPASRVRRLL
ncbi:unnamed protein product [Bursaphelenchus xylophilus]|uniref:(pine wood nematode) hypothetical protein n=1 Tax=Bursaphelenchus xylophilus TaxID=6326 RepID=A0A1I7RM31_BURXY|nr:unnamed protein product [Bursaphelenchus xylophilus]CAG9118164.1 unnamed protein product [Bursaphelenchus xylophilus]